MTIDDFRDIEYFTPGEFDHLGGYENVDASVVRLADSIRLMYERPLFITSAYRKGDTGQHGRGLALDLAPTHPDKAHYPELVTAAFRVRCGGLGIYDDDHIHIDIRAGAIGSRWVVIDKESIPWTWANINKCLQLYSTLKDAELISMDERETNP